MGNNEVGKEITEVVVIENNEVEVVISKEEAVQLTQDIKSTSTALYVLLKKAHESKAWMAMGYSSWTEYIEKEFEFSRSRSYQLINQANIIEKINETTGVPMYISEREARSIKNRLPEITQKLEEVSNDKNLSLEETKEKMREIIDEEVDNANNGKPSRQGDNNGSSKEDYDEDYDSGAMEEWKPDGIDMDKMKRMLSDDDMFIFNNLITTLKIFEAMPNPSEFGNRVKKSSQDKKELISLADKTLAWLTQIVEILE